MSDEISMDASHTSTGKFKVFSASKFDATVRLECMGFGSEIIKINERTNDITLKLDHNTLFCLRDILNRWYEAEIIKRGKE